MLQFNEYTKLYEGVYDPGIFKAFFLAGGPGSGKSYVTNKVTSGMNLKLINSDKAFESGIRKASMSFDINSMDKEDYDRAMEIRQKSKDLTKLQQSLAIKGRLGLVIDGTGKDYAKIVKQAESLKELGYRTFMIFVNTSLNTALERNQMRDRKVPEDVVKEGWHQVQENMGKFQNYFQPENFIVVDNNDAGENILLKVYKRIRNLVNTPVTNPIAKQWIQNELELKRRQ